LHRATARKQRLRITYGVDGPLRYVSHLDRMKIWERAIRRTGLPLAYSGGFNPRPRIQIAAALPVGFAADAEQVDLWLAEPVLPQAAHQALAKAVPEGLMLHRVEEVDPAEPALPSQVQAAEYEATVKTNQTLEAIRHRMDEALRADSLPRQRRGRPYDLRPLIHRLWLEGEEPGQVTIGMVLAAREGATGRPEEVLDALGLSDVFFRIRRRRLLRAET